MNYIKFFEDFGSKGITEDDIIKCIERGGTIDVEIVQNLKGKPKEPVRPVSVEGTKVTVEIDNKNYEVEMDDIIKINY